MIVPIDWIVYRRAGSAAAPSIETPIRPRSAHVSLPVIDAEVEPEHRPFALSEPEAAPSLLGTDAGNLKWTCLRSLLGCHSVAPVIQRPKGNRQSDFSPINGLHRLLIRSPVLQKSIYSSGTSCPQRGNAVRLPALR